MDDFVDIIGYEGLYKINKKGEVYSCSKKNIKKSHIRKNYLTIILFKNNKQKTELVHRLLAIQFIPNPNNYEIIDHIDQNKLNNNLENLRWIDISGNSRNHFKKRKYNLPRGVYHSGKKFCSRIIIDKIKQHLGTFDTIEEASKVYEDKYNEVMNKY